MKILGKNKAFDIINARRIARANREAVIRKNKINEDFFKTPEKPEKENKEKKEPKIPSLANTVFNLLRGEE